MPVTTTPRTVEAFTRLDTALDQLLTADILLHEAGLLTEAQTAAIAQVLDVLDLDALKALRWTLGLSTAPYAMPSSRRPFDLTAAVAR